MKTIKVRKGRPRSVAGQNQARSSNRPEVRTREIHSSRNQKPGGKRRTGAREKGTDTEPGITEVSG